MYRWRLDILQKWREWHKGDSVPDPKFPGADNPKPSPKQPKVRSPLNEREKYWLKRLSGCSFLPGHPDKRFVQDMQGSEEMTAGQHDYLWRLTYKYRRQLGMTDDMAKAAVESMKTGG